MKNDESILDNEPFFRVNAFLRKYKEAEFPILESATGSTMIKPAYRRPMKKEFQAALLADLNDLIEVDLGEAIMTIDGLMIVGQNDYEGNYTIQVDTKFKNLDYDPYDPVNSVDEDEA